MNRLLVAIKKIDTKKGLLNFTINHKKLINQYLKSLKSSGALSVEQHKKIRAVGSRPGILVFVRYIKNNVDRCPPFRLILTAIGMPSYKIANFLIRRMNSITFDELTHLFPMHFFSTP